MERLTDRYSDGTAFIPEHIKQRFGMQSAIDLLANYEDLELTPEQIRQIDVLYREKCEELAKYKKLEEQGLLLRLPCKMRDRFWELNVSNEVPYIYPRVVHSLQHCVYVLERLGKTTFLTREEAEQRLAELRGE